MKKYSNAYIKNGIINLEQWDFLKNGNVRLSGDWEFYWGKLLTYKDLNNKSLLKPGFINIPDTWNNYSDGKKKFPSFGVATYHLHVKLGTLANKVMSLSLDRFFSSYKLYINDKPIVSVGRVAKSKKDYIPKYKPVIATFLVPDKEFDIIIQVANFDYFKGGCWSHIILGTADGIMGLQEMKIGEEFFIIGALILSALYTTIIITINRASIMNIYFVIICIFGIQIYDQTSQNLIYYVFTGIPYSVSISTWYITGLWHPIFYVLYLKNLFQMTLHKWITPTIIAISLAYTIFVLVTPISIYSRYGQIGDYVMLFNMVYSFAIIVSALKQRKRGAYIYFCATSIMLFTTIHDYLYHANIIDSLHGPIAFIGFFSILLAHILMHAKISSTEYNQKVILLEEIQNSKEKAIINERKFLIAQIKPHFFFNALSVISSITVKDPVKARSLIVSLSEYLRNSFDFGNGDDLVPFDKEIELVMAFVDIEKARFGDLIRFEINCDCMPQINIPRLIIQPLVENAIRHGILKKPAGGTVKLNIITERQNIKIEVVDDGVGMGVEQIHKLLNGSEEIGGVGIRNINARLLNIYGKGLSIQSFINCGTSYSIVIPVIEN